MSATPPMRLGAPRAMVAVLALASCAEVQDSTVHHEDGDDDAEPAADTGTFEQLTLEPASLALVSGGPFTSLEGDAIIACGPGGVVVEGRSLEIRTAACDPADVGLVLPAALPAGTVLELTMSHAALVADGGEAHIAAVVGDEVAWEHRATLPAPASFIAREATLARDHAAGELVVVHVHNHGSNVYAIHGLRFSSPGAAPSP